MSGNPLLILIGLIPSELWEQLSTGLINMEIILERRRLNGGNSPRKHSGIRVQWSDKPLGSRNAHYLKWTHFKWSVFSYKGIFSKIGILHEQKATGNKIFYSVVYSDPDV